MSFLSRLCHVDFKDTHTPHTHTPEPLSLACPLITLVLSFSASFEIHLSLTLGRRCS